MPILGVNIYSNVLELSKGECISSQNLIYRNGLVKRGGSSNYSTSEVSTSLPITGLHRFYYSSSKLTIASSGTVVAKGTGSAWTNIKTGLTSGLNTEMETWGALSKMYVGNGIDRPFSYDGTDVVDSGVATVTILDYKDMSPTYTASTIAFVDSDPDTITDTANGFGDFMVGDVIVVEGSLDGQNDGTFTLEAAAAGTLTMEDSVTFTAESAGNSIKITKSPIATVDITVDGVVTNLVSATDWNTSTDNNTTASALSTKINSISGISASVSTNVITVTAGAVNDLDSIITNMDETNTLTVELLAAPRKAIQFLPYQDRLLSIDANNEGDLRWSGSFDDSVWETVANCGVKPDNKLYGMLNHSQTNDNTGNTSAVLLAGSTGVYLFEGTDLRVPYTTGNYATYKLAVNSGCNAPRTMVWTPKGAMWLGTDKQVYLLPFDSAAPIPVGHKVQSNIYLTGVKGIEDTANANISKACATYHEGFYKLAITGSGGIVNDTQWWLDVDRLYKDEKGLYGPWYGPMKGMTISIFEVMNGEDDGGQLLGGESTTSGSKVYFLGQRGVYGDLGNKISVDWWSFYNPLGNASLESAVSRVEFSLLDATSTVTAQFYDIEGLVKTSSPIGLSDAAIYWDDFYWDEFYWNSTQPVRKVFVLNPALQVRNMAIQLKNSSSDEKFELYGASVEVTEQKHIFGTTTSETVIPRGIHLTE